MVNEEILNGLKAGLERGESLKKATMTFFNSGYKKEEISEAAKLLENYQPSIQQPVQPQQIPSLQPSQPVPQQVPQYFPQQIPQQFPQMQSQQPYQQYPTPVSNYIPQPQNKAVIFILIFLLLFLIGLLAVIFLFREELVNLFSDMFV